MSDGRVQIAYLHAHNVSHSWHQSMEALVAYDAGNHGRIVGTAGPIRVRADAGALPESRNLAVTKWLDETPHEWLWFVDTDMGFAPDTVDRLVEAADPVKRPVVGALCFALREVAHDGMGGCRVVPQPTLFGLGKDPNGQVGFAPRWEYPHDSLVQVAGTGAACLLIHRGAAEKLRAEHGDRWFDRSRYGDGRAVSEDLSFCSRLAQAGIPLYVHTGVKTTHHKMLWVGEADYAPPSQVQPPAGVKVHQPEPVDG